MAGLRLMAVHAHPDDESSKGSATMARYVAEGVHVLVETCTGGERGDILNPAMDRPDIVADLTGVRVREMARAADILGVDHHWLGYVDSGLPEGDPTPPLPEGCFALADDDEVTESLVRRIREFRPHVMITYDENGGYPHPDHLKVHSASMAAYEAAADPDRYPDAGEPWAIAKVYYTHGFPKSRLQLLDDELFARDGVRHFEEFLSRWGPPRHHGAGHHAGRVRGLLRAAQLGTAGPRHPDRPQRLVLRRTRGDAAAGVAHRGVRARREPGGISTAR